MLQRMLNYASGVLDNKPSLYQDAIVRWQKASVPSHEIYRSLREIEVAFKTFDVYSLEMERLKSALLNDLPYKKDCELKVVRVCDFFMTSDLECVDVSLYYGIFRTSAIELLRIYEDKLSEIEKSAVVQSTLYNGRLLTQNVINLSEALPSD